MLVLFVALNVIATLVSSQSTTVSPSASTASTPISGWQDVALMAIRGVSEFSRVCIVTSRRDYTINVPPASTYIQFSSYRATLTGVADTVDNAFRNAEMSISRIQMSVSQISNQMNMVERILAEASAAERKILLPSTLSSIGRLLTDATSVFQGISTEFAKVVAFFEELLRAVQPNPPPSTTADPRGSTSTQANKSPLDIDHAVAISNLITYFRSLTAAWNQVASFSSNAATEATRLVQFVNDIKGLLRALSNVDDAVDLLDNLSQLYTQLSTKLFTPRTSTLSRYLMLENENDRLTEVTTVNQRETNNLLNTPKYFAELLDYHEEHVKERNERFNNLLAGASSTTPSG